MYIFWFMFLIKSNFDLNQHYLFFQASIPLKELEQFNSDIQKLLEPLEAEIQQGVNLKEEDFNKDMVNWL